MITVLGRRNSANVQKVMWTLGELGLDYERIDVGGSFGYPEDYPNPNRVVPCIVDGELTLYESNACVRYLARRYGAGRLWPDDPQLAVADQWMDWQQTSLGPFFMMFAHMIRLPPEQADPSQIEPNARRAGAQLALLDAHLADRPYIAGTALSVGDIPLGALMYRWFTLDIERPELPNVERWYARLTERPAYQKHVMVPYGSNHAEWLEREAESRDVQ